MSIRMERVASLFQKEIAGILGSEFSDQLHPMVTVTGVRVTADLSIAYVYVSVMGDSDSLKNAALAKLVELTPRVRKSLGRAIRHQVKSIPELRFFLDKTLETANKLDEIFDKIHEERDGRSLSSDEGVSSDEEEPTQSIG